MEKEISRDGDMPEDENEIENNLMIIEFHITGWDLSLGVVLDILSPFVELRLI